MYTSILLIALTGPQASVDTAAVDWKPDYATASREGKAARKPLAVFVGRGADGWAQISDTGRLGTAATDLLKDSYVCVYVDRDTQIGQKLATAFDLPSDGPGLVISDRSGELQAFRRSGKLSSEQIVNHLRTFADPNHVVRTTETGERQDVRFYPPESAAPGMGGGYYFRSGGSWGGCSSCGR
jgi:hypothetical protein